MSERLVPPGPPPDPIPGVENIARPASTWTCPKCGGVWNRDCVPARDVAARPAWERFLNWISTGRTR